MLTAAGRFRCSLTARSCCHLGSGNTPLWKKDFGAEAALASARVDPGDVRRLVLCGQRGVLIVLKLTNLARDRVEQQQYKVAWPFGCDLAKRSRKPGQMWACPG